jgi:hypothetical protein
MDDLVGIIKIVYALISALSHLIMNRVFSIKTLTFQNHKTLIFNKINFEWFTIVGIKWLFFYKCDRTKPYPITIISLY